VVVPMQEDERLFAQNDEDGVAQFWNFGQDEHGGPESRHFVLDDEAADFKKMTSLIEQKKEKSQKRLNAGH